MIGELKLTRAIIGDCSHVGDCWDDCLHWARQPRISRQMDKLEPEFIRQCLKATGGWDADELADDDANRARLLWLAACDAKEQGTCTVYLSPV